MLKLGWLFFFVLLRGVWSVGVLGEGVGLVAFTYSFKSSLAARHTLLHIRVFMCVTTLVTVSSPFLCFFVIVPASTSRIDNGSSVSLGS